jgi:Ca2+-binding EF-hand superfamily protein
MIPLAASAQDTELVFEALDDNDDGSVSQQEASLNELVSANFDAADTNNDGSLSLAEFTAAFGAG